MSGQKILLIESSAAFQELAKNILDKAGYNVITTSNGLAALTFDDLQNVDTIVVDTELNDFSGYEVVDKIRADAENFNTPILLLVPEDQVDPRSSVHLQGANAYLVKPFEPKMFLATIADLLLEKEILRRSQEHLNSSAERYISQLAENEIKNALDRRTQLIVERLIQNVTTMVEQRAKKEIDTQVTSLISEKEQELVRLTVNEVAHSMVEKLAERKVTEAMEAILQAETEKVIKRSGDILLPNIIRDKVKDSIDYSLPREVQTKVREATNQLVPEVSNKIIEMIDALAQKLVPKLGREKLPEVVEKQTRQFINKELPTMVKDFVKREFTNLWEVEMASGIKESSQKILAKVIIFNIVMMLIVIGGIIGTYFMFFKK